MRGRKGKRSQVREGLEEVRDWLCERRSRGRKGGRVRVVCPQLKLTYMQRGHGGRAARRRWHSKPCGSQPSHFTSNCTSVCICVCLCERACVCVLL